MNEIDGYVDLGLATSTLDENRQLLGGPSLASRSWPTLLTHLAHPTHTRVACPSRRAGDLPWADVPLKFLGVPLRGCCVGNNPCLSSRGDLCHSATCCAFFRGGAGDAARKARPAGQVDSKFGGSKSNPLNRALLSVNVLGPALPPLSPPVEGASAAVVGQNDDVQPVAQLISYAWSGTGQVKMFYSGRDTWQKDNPWDTNDTTPTATGPKQPAWHLDDPQGDPEDFIANSTPTLTAVFSVSPTDPKAGSQRIKTLQVEAKNLNTEGVALDFDSATVVVPLYVTRITVTLTTNDTVGNQISNSFVLLEWKEEHQRHDSPAGSCHSHDASAIVRNLWKPLEPLAQSADCGARVLRDRPGPGDHPFEHFGRLGHDR